MVAIEPEAYGQDRYLVNLLDLACILFPPKQRLSSWVRSKQNSTVFTHCIGGGVYKYIYIYKYSIFTTHIDCVFPPIQNASGAVPRDKLIAWVFVLVMNCWPLVAMPSQHHQLRQGTPWAVGERTVIWVVSKCFTYS